MRLQFSGNTTGEAPEHGSYQTQAVAPFLINFIIIKNHFRFFPKGKFVFNQILMRGLQATVNWLFPPGD